MRPKFPLLFTDEEGVTSALPDVGDIGVALEFVDDFDPPYACRDADGRPVRVIVWDLEVLALQVVPEDFDADGTEIRELRRTDGTRVLTEYFRGEPLRSVVVTPEGRRTAEPGTWEGTVETLARAGEELRMRREEFNSLWMRARGVKR
ncbi:hypothetical protein [Streptomyces glaucosporus]|uniref:hypothetical protein n=1 Tax=Streptomyces glaucosporus TaxID=284044 RepID=UPI0031D1302A